VKLSKLKKQVCEQSFFFDLKANINMDYFSLFQIFKNYYLFTTQK